MWQSLPDYLWLCLSAFLAGGINALAGGGTLLTFPALVSALSHCEAAKVLANCTSTVALVPGSLASAWGFRRELVALRWMLIWLLPPSLLGGVIGSLLVTKLPPTIFALLVPWLILAATMLFLLQPVLVKKKTAIVGSSGAEANANDVESYSPSAITGMVGIQFLIAIYGGYFGAGIGILMLSGLSLMGLTDIHQMNGLKTVLATAINSVAVIVFIMEGKVAWPYALAMMAASIVAGFLAAHYSRQIRGQYVRYFVITIGFALAAWFFVNTYLV
jgi:uncharacterized membrane protein YfcA